MSIKVFAILSALLVAVLLPPAAYSQQAGKVYRVGVLLPQSPPRQEPSKCRLLFEEALAALGYTVGHNMIVEWRYAHGLPERVTQLGEELAKQVAVDVLVVSNATTADRVREAARNVPIVVIAAGDLVAAGLVTSLARPGGNVTGLHIIQSDLAAKRLESLKQIVPSLSASASWSQEKR